MLYAEAGLELTGWLHRFRRGLRPVLGPRDLNTPRALLASAAAALREPARRSSLEGLSGVVIGVRIGSVIPPSMKLPIRSFICSGDPRR